jgi:hypothetical protein
MYVYIDEITEQGVPGRTHKAYHSFAQTSRLASLILYHTCLLRLFYNPTITYRSVNELASGAGGHKIAFYSSPIFLFL